MDSIITGLHHVTATVDEAQADLDFYTRVLGMRLVKKTVNFDNVDVYHFYYGDQQGTPGTIMTTFPYRGKGVRTGVKGAGQVTVTSFSVPAGTIGFWRERLSQHGLTVRDGGRRFGDEVLVFDDPSGLVLELVGATDPRESDWAAAEISADYAIRGLHSVTLTLRDPQPTLALLRDTLGLSVIGEEDGRIRVGTRGGGAGQVLDLLRAPDAPQSLNGIGTVHHVALAITGVEAQQVLREELVRIGRTVTEVRDRTYFRSIYFREPGGVLIEVATEAPGFAVDEAEDALGTRLMLPAWEEPRRGEIEAALPAINV